MCFGQALYDEFYLPTGHCKLMKSWIEAFLNANALRWSLFLPLVFSCGAAFYLTASFEPSWSQMAVPACLCTAIMAFSRRRYTFVLFVSLLCVLLLLGGGVAKFKAHTLNSPVLLEQIEFVRVEGVLAAVEHGDNGNRLLIQPSTISGLARDRTPRFVRVTQKKKRRSVQADPSHAWRHYLHHHIRAFPEISTFDVRRFFDNWAALDMCWVTAPPWRLI